MTLTTTQQQEVRKRLIEQLGEEPLIRMDAFFEEMNNLRMVAKDSYDFLDRVKTKYHSENVDLVLAAILYGMWQGELGYEYHIRQQQETTIERLRPEIQ